MSDLTTVRGLRLEFQISHPSAVDSPFYGDVQKNIGRFSGKQVEQAVAELYCAAMGLVGVPDGFEVKLASSANGSDCFVNASDETFLCTPSLWEIERDCSTDR